jgi:hypothetical protein
VSYGQEAALVGPAHALPSLPKRFRQTTETCRLNS